MSSAVTLLLKQAARFGVVGILTTALHVAVVLILHGNFGISPLVANFEAFLVATSVSCMLNWLWTFERSNGLAHVIPRFLALSLTCFAVNQAIVFVLVERMGQPLWFAMGIVVSVIVPLSFILNKTKVFAPSCKPAH